MAEFKKNPRWTKEKIEELHKRLGLKCSQIYKWKWDMLRKNKMGNDQVEENSNEKNQFANEGSDESGSNLCEESENFSEDIMSDQDNADMNGLADNQLH